MKAGSMCGWVALFLLDVTMGQREFIDTFNLIALQMIEFAIFS